MFGIGPQELMIIALLAMVVFGPRKASSMARDLGHFVNEARRPVEEFKSELAAVVEDRVMNPLATYIRAMVRMERPSG